METPRKFFIICGFLILNWLKNIFFVRNFHHQNLIDFLKKRKFYCGRIIDFCSIIVIIIVFRCKTTLKFSKYIHLTDIIGHTERRRLLYKLNKCN